MTSRFLLYVPPACLWLLLGLSACSDDPSPPDGTSLPFGAGTSGDAGNDPAPTQREDAGRALEGGLGGEEPDGGLVDDGEQDAEQPESPTVGRAPNDLPTPRDSCPPLEEGVQRFAGVDVQISAVGPADKHGPLVMYWHGTGGNPADEVPMGLGLAALDDVRQNGGVVAGFIAGQTRGLTTSANGVWTEGDFATADEVLACALEWGGIDPGRIHAAGMSAGGLHTTRFGYARSNYLASVVVYSGGHIVFGFFDVTDPTATDPNNLFAAMVFHGGAQDVYGLQFQPGSEKYYETLKSRGHYAMLCDHGGGHTIPTDANAAVWQFFRDHPWDTVPSPYAAGLPASMPSYCSTP